MLFCFREVGGYFIGDSLLIDGSVVMGELI